MTEKLKDLMHERADGPDFAAPDLTTLTRNGDQRIKRRRAGGAVGALAALAVVGAVVVPQLSGGGNSPGNDNQVAVEPPATNVVTWATGSVIHLGAETIDVGFDVNAFVRTSTGFVFADPQGHVYSVVGGQVSDIGRTDAGHPRLVSDRDDSLAGWVANDGAAPEFVVYDQATGETSAQSGATSAGMGELADESNPAYFYAIDDGTAYWRDERGAVSVDLDSGRTTVIDADARNGFDLIDVENGQIAFHGDGGVKIGTSLEDAKTVPGVLESGGYLSPQATYYAPDAEELVILDVETGRDVTPSLDGYFFSTGYGWLDDDTVTVIALKDSEDAEGGPISLLTCLVSAGSCEVAEENAGTSADFQFPSGEPLDD